MGKVEAANYDQPYANSAAAIYLAKQIDALSGTKNQRELARDMGYEKPNIISMFKAGVCKIPIDRVPTMAKALHVDPAHFLRLVLDQHFPEMTNTITNVLGRIVTAREFELITKWRAATNNSDPEAPTLKHLKMLCLQIKSAP